MSFKRPPRSARRIGTRAACLHLELDAPPIISPRHVRAAASRPWRPPSLGRDAARPNQLSSSGVLVQHDPTAWWAGKCSTASSTACGWTVDHGQHGAFHHCRLNNDAVALLYIAHVNSPPAFFTKVYRETHQDRLWGVLMGWRYSQQGSRAEIQERPPQKLRN